MAEREKQFVRSEWSRLLYPQDVDTARECFMIVVDTAFKIMYDHSGKSTSILGKDANLLFQMILLKCISVQSLSNGNAYQNKVELKMALKADTIDVFGIWNIVRSQFESVCTFNHIYIKPKNKEESELIYNLWEIAGLSFRQRFSKNILDQENKEKASSELRKIQDLKVRITNNIFYISLPKDEKQKVIKAINEKTFQVSFDNSKVKKVAWHEICKNLGTNDMFEEMYTFLSLNTHPSHVSIFQFENLYKERTHLKMTVFALSISKALIAFIIRDYCTYFPECLKSFEKTPPVNQLLVNSYNRIFRSDLFQLNEIARQYDISI